MRQAYFVEGVLHNDSVKEWTTEDIDGIQHHRRHRSEIEPIVSIVYAESEEEALGKYMKEFVPADGWAFVSGSPVVRPINYLPVIDAEPGDCLYIRRNDEVADEVTEDIDSEADAEE